MSEQVLEGTEVEAPKVRKSKLDRDKEYHAERSLRLKRLRHQNTSEVTAAEKALARAQDRLDNAKSKVTDYDARIEESDTFLTAFGIAVPEYVAEDGDDESDAEHDENDSDADVSEQELEDVNV